MNRMHEVAHGLARNLKISKTDQADCKADLKLILHLKNLDILSGKHT
jgi:hypothetical protein